MSLFLCVAEHKADRHADVAHHRRSAAIAPATGPAEAAWQAEELAACLELVRGQRHLCTAAIHAARVELQSREIPMVGEPPEQLKERATTIPRASNSGTQWIGTPVDARTTAAAPRVQQTTLLRRMMLGCRWRVSGPEGRDGPTGGTESERHPWKKRRWPAVWGSWPQQGVSKMGDFEGLRSGPKSAFKEFLLRLSI